MDCKTARLLLDLHRPEPDEVDVVETTALEEHLATCSECEGLARAERQADAVLAQAMRRVEVPDRLRSRLLGRLAVQRGQAHRRRYGRWVRMAAAAAILLFSAVGYSWWWNRPVAVTAETLEEVWEQFKADKVSPPDFEEFRGRFKKMGVETALPRNFSYKYLTAFGLGDFLGQQVPQLVFVREGNADTQAHAQILILTPRQFNLDQLNGNWQSEDGYPYRVQALQYPGSQQVYVIFHTGDNFDWLEERNDKAQL